MPKNKNGKSTVLANEEQQIKIYKLVRTSRHSVGLKITEDAKLVIHAPKRIPLATIDSIVENKRAWIERNIKRIREINIKFISREFKEGDEFLYLGKPFKLKLTDKPAEKPLKLNLQHSSFIANRTAFKNRESARKLFENFYRELAETELRKRAEIIAKSYNFVYEKLRVSNAKKRFGSCSSKGNINLSWRIIMAPQKVIDYVIIHELSHLKHQNHSREFWKEVEKIMPDYKSARKWIKENAHLLRI